MLLSVGVLEGVISMLKAELEHDQKILLSSGSMSWPTLARYGQV